MTVERGRNVGKRVVRKGPKRSKMKSWLRRQRKHWKWRSPQVLAVQWTPSLSLPGICSQDQLALESSGITNGHRKGHWGHYCSLAEIQFIL